MTPHERTIVIGGGLAALSAAATLVDSGRPVTVLARGMGGSTHWSSGCIDVLGRYPLSSTELVTRPLDTLRSLLTDAPDHPYTVAGEAALRQGLELVKKVSSEAGVPYEGSLEENWILPSPVGAPRPTCLAPFTMTPGNLRHPEPMLIVGFHPLRDFYPPLIAANLSNRGIPTRFCFADVPQLAQRLDLNTVTLARLFEEPEFREQIVERVRPELEGAQRIGFPAVLGLSRTGEVIEHLQEALGLPIFEIPTLPPSVPGIRLHRALQQQIEAGGGRFLVGAGVSGATIQNGRIQSVKTDVAARTQTYHGASFILATGGFLGGGFHSDYRGMVQEVVFDLPLDFPPDRRNWFTPEFMAPAGHPIWRAGVIVDRKMRPLDEEGNVVYVNLRAAGLVLANAEPMREKSLEGISVATGVRAALTEQETLQGEHP